MREAIEHIGTEIESLRTLITELRPAALDEIGLAPAIESLGERLAAVEGLEVDARGRGRRPARPGARDHRLPPRPGGAHQRRQARAAPSACAFDVALDFDVVRVEVTDDGRGFDPEARVEGFGLVGMRERVALAHGRLEIESAPGQDRRARDAAGRLGAPRARPDQRQPDQHARAAVGERLGVQRAVQ